MEGECLYGQWYRYYRDKQNRLQKRKVRRWKGKSYKQARAEKILKWLKGRVVGQVGWDSFFWFEPTRKVRQTWEGGLVFYEGKHKIEPHFRQGKRLSDKDFTFLHRLYEEERQEVCKHAPVEYIGVHDHWQVWMSKAGQGKSQ